MTQTGIGTSRILSPSKRDKYEAESGQSMGYGKMQSKGLWNLIDLGSNSGCTTY